MLKIVYPICCGMDVHKNFPCCLHCYQQIIVVSPLTKARRFSTYSSAVCVCAVIGLMTYNCKDVCMESTGKYWIPIYNVLETACKIVLAHPKYVKAIQRQENRQKRC